MAGTAELRDKINRSLWDEGIQIQGPMSDSFSDVLTAEALRFVAALSRRFEHVRRELLRQRQERQRRYDEGIRPDFPPETSRIRDARWKVAAIPQDLLDRRVEITGPVDRKMIINALNSGARVYMADFEDALSPTWANVVEGQIHLRDAVARTITAAGAEGKVYQLNEKTATLMVRPRGWHLVEKHVLIDGHPVSASLFDFGLFFFHNSHALVEEGTAPYFYLPKLEGHLEARLWNDVFNVAQDKLSIPRGTIRATALIETLPAAFEMHEILFELREHSAGLNCGRWDYIFSFIKKFRNSPPRVLPDRALVTMEEPFLKAYAELLIQTCHARHIHAMGGMAAPIPVKDDPRANRLAIEKVRQDKLREVHAGHDGTWVAHPALVPVALKAFEFMVGPHQIALARADARVTAQDLLKTPVGIVTETGLRTDVAVAIRYLESWLKGVGCVPLYGLMEDAATAEIARAQVWQWIRYGVKTADGTVITDRFVREIIDETVDALREPGGDNSCRLELAARLFEDLATAEEFPEFLTAKAYAYLD
ncbi:MAG: malate synthase A [Planctomycetes bacterium]|nr:malate synthase A [Planctomycetota bacterium]